MCQDCSKETAIWDVEIRLHHVRCFTDTWLQLTWTFGCSCNSIDYFNCGTSCTCATNRTSHTFDTGRSDHTSRSYAHSTQTVAGILAYHSGGESLGQLQQQLQKLFSLRANNQIEVLTYVDIFISRLVQIVTSLLADLLYPSSWHLVIGVFKC